MNDQIIIKAQSELRSYAEHLWFKGEDKGGTMGDLFRKHYHEVHEVIKELDELRTV